MANLERRGENTFRVRISNGSDSEGNRKMVKRTFEVDASLTEKQKLKEAEMIAAQLEAEVKRGTFLDAGKTTFAEFVEDWKKKYAEKHLAPKTYHRYIEMLSTRILPAIGHIKLERLQPTHLLDFYENLKENGIRMDGYKFFPKPDFVAILDGKGFSIKDLETKVQLHHLLVKKIKAGQAVSKKTTDRICKVLECKDTDLFDMEHDSKPLNDRTVLHHHRLISSILTCAVQWQLLMSNPASRVKPPKVEKKEAKHFEDEQTIMLLESVDRDVLDVEASDIPEVKKISLEFTARKYQAFLYVAIYCGLREGEIAGLKWDVVDLEEGIIEVKIASQYIPGKGTFEKDPKTESSERVLSLPKVVIDVLKKYETVQKKLQLKSGDAWTGSGYVFTRADGKPIHPYWATKWLPDYIRKYNLKITNDTSIPDDQKEKYFIPELNFHSTRHTNASLLISDGVSLPTVAKLLGHSVPSTTANIYSHSLKRAEKEAPTRLENRLNKKKIP